MDVLRWVWSALPLAIIRNTRRKTYPAEYEMPSADTCAINVFRLR